MTAGQGPCPADRFHRRARGRAKTAPRRQQEYSQIASTIDAMRSLATDSPCSGGMPFTDAEAFAPCPGRLFVSIIEPDRHIRTPGSWQAGLQERDERKKQPFSDPPRSDGKGYRRPAGPAFDDRSRLPANWPAGAPDRGHALFEPQWRQAVPAISGSGMRRLVRRSAAASADGGRRAGMRALLLAGARRFAGDGQ